MSKKVYIGVGHGGNDPGAVGYVTEKQVNLQIALACSQYLTDRGVEVWLSRYSDENKTLTERIHECNTLNPDLAIDIHNNAGGGDGFEVYYHFKGGKSLELAQNIEREVIALGQNSRGCKIKLNTQGTDYFGFIRETKAPAVIAEGAFVDNQNDVTFIDTLPDQKQLGEAYAKAILKTLGLYTNSVKNHAQTTHNIYKVQVGAFKDKQNAENTLKDLKNKGFNNAFIV